MFTDNLEGGFFPEELYLNDAVVTGVQHYLLAQVLMAAHNPKAPKLGPGQAMAFRATNEEIKKTVRLICGIAEVTFPGSFVRFLELIVVATVKPANRPGLRVRRPLIRVTRAEMADDVVGTRALPLPWQEIVSPTSSNRRPSTESS